MNNIFIDLDGTLIDVRHRLYSLFCFLSGVNLLSFNDYWEEKRKGKKQYDMLKEYTELDQAGRILFANKWKESIEQIELLKKDVKQDFADQLINLAQDKGNVYLWTNRQSEENLLMELEWFGWDSKFDQILITKQIKGKDELLIEILKSATANTRNLVITDTVEDYMIADQLKLDCYFYDGKTSDISEFKKEHAKRIFEEGQELIQAILKW